MLTGATFLETLNCAQITDVESYLPKFEYDYTLKMNDALIALGITDAFDMYGADFSKMETAQESFLYIDEVLHKAYIRVDELGTKAGAATLVVMESGASMPPSDIKTVRLDRPFIFAIIDNATNIPIFIGTLMTV